MKPTNLETILSDYVTMDNLPALVSDLRVYYSSLVTKEISDIKLASRLRQKIVRS